MKTEALPSDEEHNTHAACIAWNYCISQMAAQHGHKRCLLSFFTTAVPAKDMAGRAASLLNPAFTALTLGERMHDKGVKDAMIKGGKEYIIKGGK